MTSKDRLTQELKNLPDQLNNLSQFTPDFLDEREQPELPPREDIFQ